MHRFNPFQAAHSDTVGGSWNHTLNQRRKSSRQPDTPVSDGEPAEEALFDTPKAKDQQPVSNKPLMTGRSDEQLDIEPGAGDGGKRGSIISTTVGDRQAAGAVFH